MSDLKKIEKMYSLVAKDDTKPPQEEGENAVPSIHRGKLQKILT